MIKNSKLLALLFYPFLLLAVDNVEAPWFTGPLICPSPQVIPQGHFNIESNLFYNTVVGTYDSNWKYHSINPQISDLNFIENFRFGLYNKLDMAITTQFYYNLNYDPKNPWGFGDLIMRLGYQILSDKKEPFSLKIGVGEIFPLGKYQLLDETLLGTDATGGGSYGTILAITAGKIFHFSGVHYLTTRFCLEGALFSATNLHGFNAYGGDFTTDGTLHPGGVVNLITSAEYSITRKLVLALDVINTYIAKSTFHGKTIYPVGRSKESYLLSLAPALEWNFTKNFGIIGGVYLSGIGKNSIAFINGAIAVDWYI